MDEIDELNQKIYELYSKRNELQIAQRTISNSKYIGKYYREFVDDNDQYTWYTHVIRINSTGELIANIFKVDESPFSRTPKIVVTTETYCNISSSTKEISEERFYQIYTSTLEKIKEI